MNLHDTLVQELRAVIAQMREPETVKRLDGEEAQARAQAELLAERACDAAKRALDGLADSMAQGDDRTHVNTLRAWLLRAGGETTTVLRLLVVIKMAISPEQLRGETQRGTTQPEPALAQHVRAAVANALEANALFLLDADNAKAQAQAERRAEQASESAEHAIEILVQGLAIDEDRNVLNRMRSDLLAPRRQCTAKQRAGRAIESVRVLFEGAESTRPGEHSFDSEVQRAYRASQGAAVCETERVCRKAIAAGLTQSGTDIEEMLALRAELTAMLKGNALYVNSHYEDE